MTAELCDLLAGWADLWRYPALVAALERPASEFTPEEAVVGLLAGMAASHDPRGAVMQLIEQGEFGGAERSLRLLKVTNQSSGHEWEALRRDLAAARGRVLDEVRARAASLARRARQVGGSVEPPLDLEGLAAERRDAAMVRLEEWEHRISEPEQATARALRERLARVQPAATSDWTRGVLRCIEAREFGVAERLLRSGPVLGTPDTPAAVPPRKAWPYIDPPEDVIGWFLGKTAAPATFLTDWGADDPATRPVLESLQRLFAPGVAIQRDGGVERKRYLGVDEASVLAFAGALDAALGASPVTNRRVRLAGDGYETHLAGLTDPHAPWLPLGEGGLRLWVCRFAELTSPPTGAGAAAPVCFYLHSSYAAPRRMLAFDCATLFRSLGDRARLRVHLLRELGGKVELARAVPSSVPPGFLTPDVRGGISWFLDFLGLPPAGSEVFDLLEYHCGGRGDLLLLLLSAVFDCLPNRQSVVSAELISAAVRRDVFLQPAAKTLLSPLEKEPPAKAAIAAVVLAAGRPGDAVELDFVAFVGEELSGCPAPEDLPIRLARLAEQGLLDRDLVSGRYSLPPAGVGPILIEALTGPPGVDLLRSTWARG
jgi:hypothetical protein